MQIAWLIVMRELVLNNKFSIEYQQNKKKGILP